MNPCGRNYPVKRVFGGCTAIGEIDNGPQCTELINDGGTWNTSRESGSSGLPTCFPGFNYRICTKTKWPTRNLIPCCKSSLTSANDCASDWCSGSATCARALEEECTINNGERILSNVCQTYCQNPPDDRTRTWCDIASTNFCSQPENSANPYCGCINSPNPPSLVCFDNNCSSRGYRTRQLENNINRCIDSPSNLCLEVINCNNAGTCNFDNIEFTSQCQQQINTTVPVETTPVDTGIPDEEVTVPLTPVVPVQQPEPETFNYTFIIIIIVIVVVIIIIIIVAIYSSSK